MGSSCAYQRRIWAYSAFSYSPLLHNMAWEAVWWFGGASVPSNLLYSHKIYLIYVLTVLPNLPYTGFSRPTHQIPFPFSFAKAVHPENPSKSEALSRFRNTSLRRRVLSPTSKPWAGGPPLVGCPRLLIQCIHSYPPSATRGRAMPCPTRISLSTRRLLGAS
jgi:hypothetical protein